MVACAHLKKLTSKEVESLSHVKKGWQKSVQKDKSASAVVLTKELETSELLSNNAEVKTVLASTSKKFKPKFAMEIERDLRRLSPGREQLMYVPRAFAGSICSSCALAPNMPLCFYTDTCFELGLSESSHS
jgi:hypothetical protein